jgi:ankyrin repeat protein
MAVKKIIFIIVMIAAVVVCGLLTIKEYNLNFKLYSAIELGDEASAIEAIDDGANKNSFLFFILNMESLSGKPDRNPAYADTVLRQDNRIAQYLIQNGANPNYKDKDGISLLILAAKSGNLDFCKLLIKNGADVKYKCRGASALDYAITSAQIKNPALQIELIDYLYNIGVPVTAQTKRFLKRGYGFQEEASPNYELTVQYFIGKKLLSETELFQKQQYFYQISQGKIVDLDTLSKKYKLKEFYNTYSENIAMVAAKSGNTEMLKWASSQNISFNEENMGFEDVLCLAAKSGNCKTLKYAIQKINPSQNKIVDCITKVMEFASNDIISYLADQLIDLDFGKSERDATILDDAVEAQRMDVVRGLLNRGMKPNGITLINAVASRNIELTKLILQQGVSIDRTEKYSDGTRTQSALYTAIENGDLEMVKYLLKKGSKAKDAKEALENCESKRIKNCFR